MPKVAPRAPIPDVLKALSDEMRWRIVTQMAEVDELACTRLEHTLPVSKPTISYHVKILYNAGLIETRKEGRNYFYRLRRDVLDSVLAGVAEELGADRPAVSQPGGVSRAARSPRAGTGAVPRAARSG
jgi:DNA-binding transcriptional ArsR family regulator